MSLINFGLSLVRSRDDHDIETAKFSLQTLLSVSTLAGSTFLDIGCGGGYVSFAAWRLNARVFSFDYDAYAVESAQALHDRHLPGDGAWRVSSGSVLDDGYLQGLGKFDVVYAWDVLHHTGNMWQALANSASLVKPGGKLVVAVYNRRDRPGCEGMPPECDNYRPSPLDILALDATFWALSWRCIVRDLRFGKPFQAFRVKDRGSFLHDLLSWIGGYPFEVAKPEQILDFCLPLGFSLTKLRTCGGATGLNEFVFEKVAD